MGDRAHWLALSRGPPDAVVDGARWQKQESGSARCGEGRTEEERDGRSGREGECGVKKGTRRKSGADEEAWWRRRRGRTRLPMGVWLGGANYFKAFFFLLGRPLNLSFAKIKSPAAENRCIFTGIFLVSSAYKN